MNRKAWTAIDPGAVTTEALSVLHYLGQTPEGLSFVWRPGRPDVWPFRYATACLVARGLAMWVRERDGHLKAFITPEGQAELAAASAGGDALDAPVVAAGSGD